MSRAATEGRRRTGGLADFWAALPYEPDPFQLEAAEALEAGATVVVTAPTGSGKTLVAEAAVHLALGRRERAFYTTPIKALSNQKYGDFIALYGSDMVGLLTGDNSINGSAPIVVMTTEVLRNMIYARADDLNGLGVAVLDEVHYLQDRSRGAVWEEIIIHAPRHVQLVGLSATIANAPEFAAWVETRRGHTVLVEELTRPVPLESRYLVKDKWSDPPLRLYPTFRGDDGARRPNAGVIRLLAHGNRRRFGTPRRTETVEFLASEGVLPAIYFIFSRSGCEAAARQVVGDGVRLTAPDERDGIRAMAEARTSHLGERDLAVLGYDRWLAHLEHGVAAHHAGLVPAFKETVEDLFARGLVQVVFATETLALGINMPAKTVVLESLSKFSGEGHELLQPGDYTQLTGRAGRRGIDLRGFGVVLHSPYVRFEQVAEIAAAGSHELVSSFRPTYNMAANLVANYPRDEAEELLAASFAQFQRRERAEALAFSLEALEAEVVRLRAGAKCERGDVWSYLELIDAADARTRHKNRGMFANQLRVGDVVDIPRGRRAGRYVVLFRRPGGHGDEGRIVMLGTSGKVTTWDWQDLAEGTARVGQLPLPAPFRPRERRYQQQLMRQLRAFRPHGQPATAPLEQRAEHPVASCPDVAEHIRAARRARRAEHRLTRLRVEAARTGEGLIQDFEAILDVLGWWGYVDGWSLTGRGDRLRFVYNELDLLLAEAVERGALIGLTTPELVALASAFVFEPRADDLTGGWPSSESALRFDTVSRLWQELTAEERVRRLPETRPPESGFASLAHRWAAGEDLEDFLEESGVPPGDFVRVCRQVLDLLRQIRDAWPELAPSAEHAIDAVDRGVVAAGGIG